MAEPKLQGKKVAILAAEMFEEVELVEPGKALDDAGADTELISLKPGEVQGFKHYDRAGSHKVDKTVGNPDQLRQDENAVQFVRSFFEQGKPVAAICHAPWTLVEAGVVRGRRLTSYASVQTDIRNAGGEWVNEEVVVDAGLVTSRGPHDIPAFTKRMLEEFAEGRHREQADKTRAAVHADATPS